MTAFLLFPYFPLLSRVSLRVLKQRVTRGEMQVFRCAMQIFHPAVQIFHHTMQIFQPRCKFYTSYLRIWPLRNLNWTHLIFTTRYCPPPGQS
mgnify:CR=1 FL=1